MKETITKLRRQFEARNNRERLVITILSWVLIYVIFNYIFYDPLNEKISQTSAEMANIDKEMDVWRAQINSLNQLSKSPIYVQWLKQQAVSQGLQTQFKNLMQNNSVSQWQGLMQNILKMHTDIVVSQIRSLPEATAKIPNATVKTSVLTQQGMIITVFGSYFSVLNYLKELEQALPNISWVRFDYQVSQYPIAKVDLELALYYDKGK